MFKRSSGVVAVAVGIVVATGVAAFAEAEDGHIDCGNVAAVQSKTEGPTYVAPPGEAARDLGNLPKWSVRQTYEAGPSGTYWSVIASDIANTETYAYCTGIAW